MTPEEISRDVDDSVYTVLECANTTALLSCGYKETDAGNTPEVRRERLRLLDMALIRLHAEREKLARRVRSERT